MDLRESPPFPSLRSICFYLGKSIWKMCMRWANACSLVLTQWHELELSPPLRDVIWWRLGTAAYDARKEDEATKALEELLGYLEKTLEGRAWLVNEDQSAGPSLADLTVGASVLFACRFYIDKAMRERLPNTMAHLARLRSVQGLRELFTIHMIEERRPPPGASS